MINSVSVDFGVVIFPGLRENLTDFLGTEVSFSVNFKIGLAGVILIGVVVDSPVMK